MITKDGYRKSVEIYSVMLSNLFMAITAPLYGKIYKPANISITALFSWELMQIGTNVPFRTPNLKYVACFGVPGLTTRATRVFLLKH
ncbi:MAG: hypothetical protein PHH57_08690 [Candidatus Omnitrophica bacterium]|nr:hypothetical protein [Candidatus Omnitrophota bacterium]